MAGRCSVNLSNLLSNGCSLWLLSLAHAPQSTHTPGKDRKNDAKHATIIVGSSAETGRSCTFSITRSESVRRASLNTDCKLILSCSPANLLRDSICKWPNQNPVDTCAHVEHELRHVNHPHRSSQLERETLAHRSFATTVRTSDEHHGTLRVLHRLVEPPLPKQNRTRLLKRCQALHEENSEKEKSAADLLKRYHTLHSLSHTVAENKTIEPMLRYLQDVKCYKETLREGSA